MPAMLLDFAGPALPVEQKVSLPTSNKFCFMLKEHGDGTGSIGAEHLPSQVWHGPLQKDDGTPHTLGLVHIKTLSWTLISHKRSTWESPRLDSLMVLEIMLGTKFPLVGK